MPGALPGGFAVAPRQRPVGDPGSMEWGEVNYRLFRYNKRTGEKMRLDERAFSFLRNPGFHDVHQTFLTASKTEYLTVQCRAVSIEECKSSCTSSLWGSLDVRVAFMDDRIDGKIITSNCIARRVGLGVKTRWQVASHDKEVDYLLEICVREYMPAK
jgi:hypothetical protein